MLLINDSLLIFCNLHEALAVCLMCIDRCGSIASASHSTSTVVCIAAWRAIIPFENEISEGEASKSEENECWSHDERLFDRERFGIGCEVESLIVMK